MRCLRALKSLKVGVILVFAAGTWSGCASPGKNTAIGATSGAAGGAIIGAIAGGGTKGAAIGAVAGGAVGAAIGNYLDKQAQELAQVAETHRMANGILLNLKNDLLFTTGSASLKPEAMTELGKLGDIVAKYPEDRIRILGHTDNVGSTPLNEKLSQRRSQSVANVLKQKGVKPAQLITMGLGETDPVASNDTPDGRSKNRRVEMFIDIPQENAKAVAQKTESKTS